MLAYSSLSMDTQYFFLSDYDLFKKIKIKNETKMREQTEGNCLDFNRNIC